MANEENSESKHRVNRNDLERILEEEVGYSRAIAKSNAQSLLGFVSHEHDDLDKALYRWVAERSDMAIVSEGAFNTFDLVNSGLTYPAALIFIDWARSDPASAARLLADRAQGLSTSRKS